VSTHCWIMRRHTAILRRALASLGVLWVLTEGYCEYSLLDHAAAHGHLEAVDQIVNGHLELRRARGRPHMGCPHMGCPHVGYPHGAQLTHTYVDIDMCM
jgi:hypothetical protein